MICYANHLKIYDNLYSFMDKIIMIILEKLTTNMNYNFNNVNLLIMFLHCHKEILFYCLTKKSKVKLVIVFLLKTFSPYFH